MPSDRRSAAEPHLIALGQQVRRLRVERGMTQEDLAHAAGLGTNVISQVENARRDVRVSALWLLARSLGVRVQDLVADL